MQKSKVWAAAESLAYAFVWARCGPLQAIRALDIAAIERQTGTVVAAGSQSPTSAWVGPGVATVVRARVGR
jgi:hypothetical protein